MVLQLLIMAAVLAVACYGVGTLPLSYSFSKSHLQRLSVLGTGLLLGAALGVIIPEGIETIVEDNKVPVQRIALCLVFGFVLMVIVEQLFTPTEHSHSVDISFKPIHKTSGALPQVEFDADLEGLEDTESSPRHSVAISTAPNNTNLVAGSERAFTLFLGLVIHAAADGLALGVANLDGKEKGKPDPVSLVVFLALILHKAKVPTSLAFATSLLSTNISRSNCHKYVAIFSASTPLSAIASYMAFHSLNSVNHESVKGTALLISGGSFLYVATVLQPVSHHSTSPGDMRPISRVLFIVVGMLIPLVLSAIIGHGH